MEDKLDGVMAAISNLDFNLEDLNDPKKIEGTVDLMTLNYLVETVTKEKEENKQKQTMVN